MPELICQSLKWLPPRCKAMYYQLLEWFILLNSFRHESGCKGRLISQFLPAPSSGFAHSWIQTGKWLTWHFSFTDSCWGIIGEGENEQSSIICKVLRLAKKGGGGGINLGKAGETARQWKIGGELENTHFKSKGETKLWRNWKKQMQGKQGEIYWNVLSLLFKVK